MKCEKCNADLSLIHEFTTPIVTDDILPHVELVSEYLCNTCGNMQVDVN